MLTAGDRAYEREQAGTGLLMDREVMDPDRGMDMALSGFVFVTIIDLSKEIYMEGIKLFIYKYHRNQAWRNLGK